QPRLSSFLHLRTHLSSPSHTFNLRRTPRCQKRVAVVLTMRMIILAKTAVKITPTFQVMEKTTDTLMVEKFTTTTLDMTGPKCPSHRTQSRMHHPQMATSRLRITTTRKSAKYHNRMG